MTAFWSRWGVPVAFFLAGALACWAVAEFAGILLLRRYRRQRHEEWKPDIALFWHGVARTFRPGDTTLRVDLYCRNRAPLEYKIERIQGSYLFAGQYQLDVDWVPKGEPVAVPPRFGEDTPLGCYEKDLPPHIPASALQGPTAFRNGVAVVRRLENGAPEQRCRVLIERLYFA